MKILYTVCVLMILCAAFAHAEYIIVNGSITTNTLKSFDTPSNGVSYIDLLDPSYSFVFHLSNNNDLITVRSDGEVTDNNGDWKLGTSSDSSYVQGTNGGNFGIGTPNPQKTLDVRGTAYISGATGIGTLTPRGIFDVVNPLPVFSSYTSFASGIGNGNYYSYGNVFGAKIFAYDNLGNIIGQSDTGLTADPGDFTTMTISFSWDSVPSADHYRLFFYDPWYVGSDYVSNTQYIDVYGKSISFGTYDFNEYYTQYGTIPLLGGGMYIDANGDVRADNNIYAKNLFSTNDSLIRFGHHAGDGWAGYEGLAINDPVSSGGMNSGVFKELGGPMDFGVNMEETGSSVLSDHAGVMLQLDPRNVFGRFKIYTREPNTRQLTSPLAITELGFFNIGGAQGSNDNQALIYAYPLHAGYPLMRLRDNSGAIRLDLSETGDLTNINSIQPSNYKSSDGTTGSTKTVTVRNSAGTGTCTMIFKNGLYTGGTC